MLISLIFFNQPSLLMEKSSSSFYAINPGELRASEVIEGDRAPLRGSLLFVYLFVCATHEVDAEGILTLKWLHKPRPQNPSNLTNSPPTRKQLAPPVLIGRNWNSNRVSGMTLTSCQQFGHVSLFLGSVCVCVSAAEENTRLQCLQIVKGPYTQGGIYYANKFLDLNLLKPMEPIIPPANVRAAKKQRLFFSLLCPNVHKWISESWASD